MRTRHVVANTPFTAIFYRAGEDYLDLVCTVLKSDWTTVIESVLPAPVFSLPGAYKTALTLPEGQYILKWGLFGGGAVGFDNVIVSKARPDSGWAVGKQYRFTFSYTEPVSLRMFGPDFKELSGSPFGTTEVSEGVFSTGPIGVDAEGAYLLAWFSGGEFIDHDVLDVWPPEDYRIVKAGFLLENRDPYPNLRVTFTREDFGMAEHGVTDGNGVVLFTLKDGRYYVTVQDPSRPGRVFTRNNFGPYEVVDPTTRPSGNEAQWTVAWLDVASSDLIRVPSSKRSIMHVNLLKGPSGEPDKYRRFTVETTSVWRYQGLIVAPGKQEWTLDMNGSASVPLIRGTQVHVVFPLAGVTVKFEVPDEEEFFLSQQTGRDPFTVTTPKRTYPVRVS